MNEEQTKVRFKHLSFPVKLAVIMGWLLGALWVSTFVGGFLLGFIQ